MKKMGINKRIENVKEDIEFEMKVKEEGRKEKEGRRWIGIGVMKYSGWKKEREKEKVIYEKYIEKMEEMEEGIIE